ncbi:MAG TPA: hypothetical protein VFU28_26780 [Vicinamibacterales bacterium]|nr:hypothetical protein [Vicinamibacterales bacterium]
MSPVTRGQLDRLAPLQGAEVAGAGIVMVGIGAGLGAAVDASIHLVALTAGGVRVSLQF